MEQKNVLKSKIFQNFQSIAEERSTWLRVERDVQPQPTSHASFMCSCKVLAGVNPAIPCQRMFHQAAGW